MINYKQNLKRKIVLPAQAVAGQSAQAKILGLPELKDCAIFYSELQTTEEGHKDSYSAYIYVPLRVKLLAENEDYTDSCALDVTIQAMVTQTQTKGNSTDTLINSVEQQATDTAEIICAKLGKLAQITDTVTITPRYVGLDNRTKEHIISLYMYDIQAVAS